jgi:hypothetical protein
MRISVNYFDNFASLCASLCFGGFVAKFFLPLKHKITKFPLAAKGLPTAQH